MSTKYVVEIDLRTTGNLPQTVSSAAGKFDALAGAASRAYGMVNSFGAGALSGFTRSVEWAAGKVWDIGKAFGAAGLAAGVSAAAYGVFSLNKELETTKVSLGAVFGASGFTKDVGSGLQLGADMIKQMRQDAKKLPGEFSDLLGIFQTAAVPAFKSGLDPASWEQLSSKVMATAKAVSLPMDQAAREFAQLLEGRSGAHNVFGMRLLGLSGETAKQFNQSKPEERLKLLTTELDKYGKYIDAFGDTFEAQSSTAIDNGKEFLRVATEPLFERGKETLKDINKWFEKNSDQISVWAINLGAHLGKAWDWGRKKAEEWYPLIRDFAGTAWDRLKKFWDDIGPKVEAFAGWMKESLKDPNGTIDKLLLLGKLYVGAKVAEGGLGMLGGLGQTAGSAIPLMAQLGVFGGGAVTAGAGAAGAGAGAAGGAGAGMLAGLAGAATVAGAALAALAGVGLAVWQGMGLYDDIQKDLNTDLRIMHDSARRAISAYDKMSNDWAEVTARAAVDIDALRKAGADTAAAVYELELASYQAAAAMRSMVKDRWDNRDKGITDAAAAAAQQAQMELLRRKGLIGGSLSGAAGDKVKRKGGHGGTSIQKVEIVVTSNQNPERIARSVTDELAKLSRNRKASRFVTNYSSPTKA